MTIRFSRALRPLAAALLGASLLAACGGSDDNLDDRLGTADPKMRFVHAAPTGSTVALYRNDAKQADASSENYLNGTRYFNIAEGNATWAVKGITDPPPTLGSVSIDAKKGRKYTIVALPASAASSLDLLLIDDPYDKGLTSNQARLRVVNDAPDATSVDVYLTSPATDIAKVSPSFAQVGYKGVNPASGIDSFSIDGGTWLLRVTPAGSKYVIFSKPLKVDSNADWLLTLVPADPAAPPPAAPPASAPAGTTPVAKPPRLLLVRADDQNASQPTVELFTTD